MKNIGARPVFAPSVIETSISWRISSKLIGPGRLVPRGRGRPKVAACPTLLLELPSSPFVLQYHNCHRMMSPQHKNIYLLVLAKPPRLPVMMGPKISFAILKYGVLLLPDTWNGPIEKSLKTPRMNCWSSCSSEF